MDLYSISKHFQPSIISDLLEFRDEDGTLIRRYRDVEFLRREQNFSQYCDYERLKTYVNMSLTPSQSIQFSNDEEAFRSIMPRSVDNPTMFYEYSKHLKSEYDKARSTYDSEIGSYKRAQDFIRTYTSAPASSSTSTSESASK